MCLRGDQAARKLTPQIEAYVRARWPDFNRAGTYGIGKRLRQESSRSSQWSFARKRCVPLLGELKLQAVPATRARLEESESVPTKQPQTVSRTLGKTSLEINGLALRARRPIAIVGPKMPGNRQGLPPPQAPTPRRTPVV